MIDTFNSIHIIHLPMAIPTFEDLIGPSLLALRDGKEHYIKEVFDSASKTLGLTQDELSVKMENQAVGVAYYRAHWALTYLVKAGLITRVKRGTYQITDSGNSLLQKKLSKIDINYLKENYESLREWVSGSKGQGQDSQEPVISSSGTPEEIIDYNLELINRDLGQQLIDSILKKSPSFFEYVVKQLLQAMGYGEGDVTGQSGDEGIDGFMNEDALGLETIYFQAKRYAPGTPIPQSMIRDFIGTLQMHGKDKGVFITTSSLPKGVEEIAAKSHKKVVFVDGAKLVRLMINYDVGVRTINTLKIKAIDQDFFDAENGI